MTVAQLVDESEATDLGRSAHDLMAELAPFCRSITGDGVRCTLERISKEIPLRVHEVPSGTKVLDWAIPEEWNVRDAYIADSQGRRLVDFQTSPLHLVSYSTPVNSVMDRDELLPHIHTLPERPTWVPYRTQYYKPGWGFCLSQEQWDGLGPGPFTVVIDSTLSQGFLTYGECVLPGESADEILLSTHVCHPAMANDNLSGIAIATIVARLLAGTQHRWTYRIIFIPGTIGSISWLSQNVDLLSRIQHGLVLTGLGGPGGLVYKQTRRGERRIDDAASHVVTLIGGETRSYSPYGYDERQFNSLGFDLPVGRLSRTPHGEYSEYHTSADNLDFVRPEHLAGSLMAVLEILDVLEHDATYVNLSPHGEPQLGRRGLYPAVGGRSAEDSVMAMLWVLGFSDGKTTLLDIARRSGLSFAKLRRAAAALAHTDLLVETSR